MQRYNEKWWKVPDERVAAIKFISISQNENKWFQYLAKAGRHVLGLCSAGKSSYSVRWCALVGNCFLNAASVHVLLFFSLELKLLGLLDYIKRDLHSVASFLHYYLEMPEKIHWIIRLIVKTSFFVNCILVFPGRTCATVVLEAIIRIRTKLVYSIFWVTANSINLHFLLIDRALIFDVHFHLLVCFIQTMHPYLIFCPSNIKDDNSFQKHIYIINISLTNEIVKKNFCKYFDV